MIEEKREEVTSVARQVTFFEDRAQVARTVKIETGERVRWFSVTGITPFVDERSVQVKVGAGELRVLSARVRRGTTYKALLDNEALLELEQARDHAEIRLREIVMRRERAEASQKRDLLLLEGWRRELLKGPSSSGLDVASWRRSHEVLEGSVLERTKLLEGLRCEGEDVREELSRLQERLRQGRVRSPKYSARIEVQLEGRGAGELEMSYRTPCALWRPEHLLRLRSSEEGQAVELVTWGTIWQRTGERWEDVEVICSTARPANSSRAPAIADDVLSKRVKDEQERQVVRVEMQEREKAAERLSGSSQEEMPGVDDGGEPLQFKGRAPMSLNSDGAPVRVEIVREVMKAEVSKALIAEKSATAHLKAKLVLIGDAPILAGPVKIARGGGLIGRSTLDFVAPGEAFEVGFGPDDGVRAQREVKDEKDKTVITGHQTVKREVRLYLSNLSGEEKTLDVIERIPVSDIDDVEVKLIDGEGWSYNSEDGFLRRHMVLAPGAAETLSLSYKLQAGSHVVLPF